MRVYTSIALLLACSAQAALKEKEIPPGFKLRIEAQMPLTDLTGIILPSQIIKTTVGQLVTMYRTDGFKYDAQVTSIEESDSYLKVYGKVLNVEDTGFGFILARGGNFAGAVVERKADKTYVVNFDEHRKGFVFTPTSRFQALSFNL